MLRRLITLWGTMLAIGLAASGCANVAPSGGAQLVTETFMVPAADPGIQLHVRNRRPAGDDKFAANRIVLFVHGATYPAATGFDMISPADRGSTTSPSAASTSIASTCGATAAPRGRPHGGPCGPNPPFVDTAEAVRDALQPRSTSS